MRVLVTGAGGFVGRHLVHAMSGRFDVTAIDADLSALRPGPSLCLCEGDLADAGLLGSAMAEGIDGVVHLAAVPGGAAEADPALSRRVNIDATLDLLDACAAAGQSPRVVFASTIAVFGAASARHHCASRRAIWPEIRVHERSVSCPEGWAALHLAGFAVRHDVVDVGAVRCREPDACAQRERHDAPALGASPGRQPAFG